MKRYIKLIVVAVVCTLAYLAGFLHGNRSAAVVCLEQSAADAHAGYRMLTDPKFQQWRSGTDRMLLGAATRALREEKALLSNPLRLYRRRRHDSEEDNRNATDRRQQIDGLLSQWDTILKTNGVPEAQNKVLDATSL